MDVQINFFCKKRLIVCKKKFVLKLKTRYAETDQMGVIHHGSYATYFELARIEWLRSLGLSYAKLEKQGILLPVCNPLMATLVKGHLP